MRMVDALREPLPAKALALVTLGLVSAVALYCLAYNAFAGRTESLSAAAAWAVINVAPWFLAFEAAKRNGSNMWSLAMVGAALFASMTLHVLLNGLPDQPLFELVRRLPATLALAALLGLRRRAAAVTKPAGGELPLLPLQIDWVSAAGNYVELHACGRVIVHRASLNSVEAQLARLGFVRIHRSTLVRRSAIARVRAVDLLLRDGTSLKLGKRYRSALLAATGDFRPLVPAE